MTSVNFHQWNPFDLSAIKQGFNFGLGTCVAGAIVGGVVSAAKAAYIYKTTVVGAQAGLAAGGPAGAVIGGMGGAVLGVLV